MTIINMSGGKPAKPVVVEAVEETPSTLPYTFSPREGVDYLSSVTVGKDPNLVPENVKKDVSIFGVMGTYQGSGGGSIADYVIPWPCSSLPFIPLTEFEGERPAGADASVYFTRPQFAVTLADSATGDVHVKPNPGIDYYTGPYRMTPMQVDIAQGSHTSLPVSTLGTSSGTTTNLAGEIRTAINQVFPGTYSTELPFTGTVIPVAFGKINPYSSLAIGWESQPEPIAITGVLSPGQGSATKTTMTVNIPSDISMLCYCSGMGTGNLYMGLAIIDLAFDMRDYI